VIRIGFGGLPALIGQIEISGMTTGGTRRTGVGFDTFTAAITPVPLPAGLPMVAAGLGALGYLRSRRRT